MMQPQLLRRRAKRNNRRQAQRCMESLESRCLLAGLEWAAVGTFATGIFDDGGAEIVAYDSATHRAFFTSAGANELGVLDLSDPTNPTPLAGVHPIDLSAYGGGPNSVAVANGIVAVAEQANDKTAPGSVVFFDTAGNFLNQVMVGALPDMVTFAPDGMKLLVANEGEPNSYNQLDSVDPEGSVSIVDLTAGVASATVQTAGFTAFNGLEASLIASGVRIFGPNATVAQDLEPEYITVSEDGATAYVTLQENNALGVVDIASATVIDILPLGYKDHHATGNGLDASDRDGIANIQNWPVLGMYQPDAVASYSVGGVTYLVTANEGDARDYDGFAEEERVKDLTLDPVAYPDPSLQDDDKLGRLTVTTVNGNTDADAEYEQLYVFGSRSFSVWTADGQQVFDSGDDFERLTAAAYPGNFNASNDNNTFDNRSDNKGPEPEGITLGVINGRTYAFIGLERMGGVMIYDVTDPSQPVFEQYINNRDFSQDPETGAPLDLGIEGLTFVPAEDSPSGIPLLLTANEISGTVSVYQVSGTLLNDGVLQIYGTAADDQIDISRGGRHGLEVTASFLVPHSETFRLADVSRIQVNAGAGNDRVIISANVSIRSWIDGGAGNDFLFGGSGNDEIFGGDGHDWLFGNRGKDRLFGGDGNDVLFGGLGEDWLDGGDDFDWLIGGFGHDRFRNGEIVLP